MTTRVAAYVRVSTSGQVEKWGLPTQRAAIEDHVRRNKWTIIEWYEDPGISGETIDARPAMRRMLDDVRDGRFDVVLAVEWERFSRSRHGNDWATILSAVEDGHAKLATPSQTLDPASPEDGFLGGLFGLLASREKRKIVERTRRGRRARAAEGKWAVGVAPFGYVVGADGRLVVDEERAAVVRDVFAMILDGKPLAHVAQELNRRGVVPPGRFVNGRGAEWRPVAIRRMLENETYSGRLVFGSRTHAKGDQPVVVEDAHPAIVPAHELARVRAVFAARKSASYPRSHWHAGYLLSGILLCPKCGHTMAGTWSPDRHGGKLRYYTCAGKYTPGTPRCGKLRADPLERAVLDDLARALAAPDVLAEVRRQAVEEMLRDSTDDAKRRAELDGSIAESARRVRLLWDDRAAGLISPAQFGEFNAEETANQTSMRREIRAIEGRLLALGRHADVESVVGRLADLGSALDVLDSAERKSILAETVAAVHVSRREDATPDVRVEYRLPGLGAAQAGHAEPRARRRAIGQ
jgi:site-specific DNA recombinase